MAINNTTFTPITTGTRDSSSDKGALYYLDGNATNGRLNIADGAKWIAGNDTTVVYDGNTSHSYMLGTIQANDFKIIAIPNTNGRIDFGGTTAGWDVENISFVFLGNGSIYNHLEDNNSRSNFRGNTKFKIDMASGEAYLQFSSKEYRDISLDVKSSNNATLNIFPARSTDGFTSFTGFKTIGLNSAILKTGLTSTSHGRIYDPVYDGVTNNLLPLQTDSTSDSNRAIEYFSIDVTDISNTNTKALVKDGNNTVLFNDNLNSSLLEPKANDGTTLLDFYSGKKVILCEVRRINNILSTTRNQIEYLIRRNGYNQIKTDLFDMNNPISIDEMIIDVNYSDNVGLTEISNSEELYDMYKNYLTDNIDIEDTISVNGSSLVIANGWTLVRNQTLTNPIEVVGTEIRVKTAVGGLQKTSKFDSFIGDIDSSFDENTNMLYLNSAGNTTVRFNNLNPEGFNLHVDYPANVLVRQNGTTTWTNLNTSTENSISFNPAPNEDWEYSIRVPGYDWIETTTFNTGDYGLEIDVILTPIKDLDGANIFSKTVDESIVSSFTYDFVNNRVLQENTTGSLMQINFTEAFVGMQRIEHNPTLVTQLVERMIPNAERNGFVLDNNSSVTFKSADTSNANVQLLFNIVSIVNGERVLQIDRFISSVNGYYILMSSEVVNFSAPFPTAEASAAAVRSELSIELARIDENISAEKNVNIKKVNDIAVTDINDFKADVSLLATQTSVDDIPTDTEMDLKFSTKATSDTTRFDTLDTNIQTIDDNVDGIKTNTDKLQFKIDNDLKVTLDGEEVVTDSVSREASKATVNTLNEITDAILDVPYGTKTDGITPLGVGTLGEHWWQFYPPEIIRQLLETQLNGISTPTRFNPIPGFYGDGTLGDALREILNRSTQDSVDNIPTNTEMNSKFSTQTTSLEGRFDTVDTNVTEIKTKVDNLPDNTETTLSTIDTEVKDTKTVVDNIKLNMDNMPRG